MVEEYQGMNPEDLDDEELETLEQDNAPKKKPVAKPKAVKKPVAKPKEVINKRYGVFANPERLGIVDRETGEVVAEGNMATLEILAEILERLERIETNLGSMMGGQ